METVAGRVDSPIENIGRTTRRSRTNKIITTKFNGKDQENVNNSLVRDSCESTTVQDEVTKPSTSDEKQQIPTTNLNSSTPRRKKDPLANLHSNLSPKYIGFTTPPHQLNSSGEERTRSLRKRHNNTKIINETTEEKNKDMEVDLTFTPNTESTVGFVRRTPRSRESLITPDNNIKRKKFVSPIDKLLIKNGAVMEFNNNLPLINHDLVMVKRTKVIKSCENKNESYEKELGVKELDDCDENSDAYEITFSCARNGKEIDKRDENSEDNDSQSSSCKNAEELDESDKTSDDNEIQSSSRNNEKKLDDCVEESTEHNEIHPSSCNSDREVDNCDGNSENKEIQSSSCENEKKLNACEKDDENSETQSMNDFDEPPDSIAILSSSYTDDKEHEDCDAKTANNKMQSSSFENNNELEDCGEISEKSTSVKNGIDEDENTELEFIDEKSESNESVSDIIEIDDNDDDDNENEENQTDNDNELHDGCNEDKVSISTEVAEDIDDDDDNENVVESGEYIQTRSDEIKCNDSDEEDVQSEADKDTRKIDGVPEVSLGCEIVDLTIKEEQSEELLAIEIKDQKKKEFVEGKSHHNQKTSTHEAKSKDSLLYDKQTAQILKVIEQCNDSVIKIEVESAETESNNEFVDAPSTTTNSPSTVSIDSAKGSSIVNGGSSWTTFTTGELCWGQIYNFCYWPCIVCPDPDGKTIITEEMDRSSEQKVHVRFFADNGRRNWVKRENLMPFVGIESYQERIDEVREKYGSKSANYKLYVPTKKKESVWFEAVNEANIVAEVPYANRLEKFYEIFEKSKAFHKLKNQRRKSMYISVKSGTGSDIESFYGSNDNINNIALAAAMKNKRERSISPYSPAYSPIKPVAAKRRKLSGEQESSSSSSRRALLPNNPEENPNSSASLNLSQTNSIASTSSNSNFLNDVDLYNSLEFRKLYGYMRDYVMEQNQDDKLEKSLVVAVRNIWALRQLNRQQMERKLRQSLTENGINPAFEMNYYRSNGEGSAKRLSSRLKTLMVRKSLIAQKNQESMQERSETPQSKETTTMEKVKIPINRPILEVIDDIFDLDTKYLFKGMCREPVCKYCLKPGDLRKCKKNCTHWLHEGCLHIDFDQKVRRGSKAINGTKTNKGSLNGSQSSSLVSLTEVGKENHVTGDSDTPTPLAAASDVICKECSNNEPPKCMVCNCNESNKPDDLLVKCCMAQCERSFHPACCKYWPQAKITISKNVIESFRCPSHVCHTCVSDDPKGKFQHLSNAKLTKCIKCPATYHTDSTCIPAGSQIKTAAHIICPRHLSTKLDMTVNVNWCFICVGGGQLTCCETCPTAVHAHCLKIPIDPNEGYICEECESGRMPLYGEMVWAKFRNFRWWPAIILPPTEIPKNIARKTHNPSDFVVRFFGTHDHGWISRRRVYLYVEGDSSEPPKSKSGLDLRYNKGVEEAKEMYEIIKTKKIEQRNSNENKEKLHPQPYVRIKANRPVPPVKLHINIEKVSKCECDAREENPCGPDTNCLNRVLYHECNPKICPAAERCQNQMFESRVSPRLDVVYMKERGFGLVCRELIKAGSFVIEYVGEIINDNEFQARMQQKSQDRDENFYFLSVEKDYIIDAGPKGNLARFMNHSCDPNCETQKWSVNSLNRVGLFAIKDIPENTELTFNYHWDDLLGNEKKTCYCGAKTCGGQIGAKPKDMETVKLPPTVIETGKKLLKIKPKPKSKQKINKLLLNDKGLKKKLTSKLKVKGKTKTITKKITAASVSAVGIGKYLQSKAPPTTSNALTEESDTKTEEEATSTSRLLESPDLFE